MGRDNAPVGSCLGDRLAQSCSAVPEATPRPASKIGINTSMSAAGLDTSDLQDLPVLITALKAFGLSALNQDLLSCRRRACGVLASLLRLFTALLQRRAAAALR